jgi:hypothetical protein
MFLQWASSNLCYSSFVMCSSLISSCFRDFSLRMRHFTILFIHIALICPNAGQYSLFILCFIFVNSPLCSSSINSFNRSRASVLNFRLVHLDEPVLKEQKAQSFHRCTEQCLFKFSKWKNQFLIIIVICVSKPN